MSSETEIAELVTELRETNELVRQRYAGGSSGGGSRATITINGGTAVSILCCIVSGLCLVAMLMVSKDVDRALINSKIDSTAREQSVEAWIATINKQMAKLQAQQETKNGSGNNR